MRFFNIVTLLLVGTGLTNGPVNSDNSSPFAAVNKNGNMLLVGDLKVLMLWNGRSSASRFTFKSDSDRFTGGISDYQHNSISGIACNLKETWIFNPTRSKSFPGGAWTKLKENQSIGSPNESRLCAITTNGHFAQLFLQSQLLLVDGSKTISLESLGKISSRDKLDLIASGESLLIISSNGNALRINSNDLAFLNNKNVISHPYYSGYWSDNIRFAASSNVLLKIDSNQVELSNLTTSKLSPIRLPINPCDDKETCSPFISNIDDSWSLSGLWGHYVGKGTVYSRLKLPNAANGKSGVAFAHQSLDGKFVYLGNDDGDMGSLVDLKNRVGGSSSKFNLTIPIIDKLSQFTHSLNNPSDMSTSWWVNYLRVHDCWKLVDAASIKPALVKIGVIDSGALMTHRSLKDGLFPNPLEIQNNNLDDEDNGFVDDFFGYDYVQENSLIRDDFGHGTHVSGLLIGKDAAPASRNAKLTVIRALDGAGKSTSIDLARALYYSIDFGIEVLNLSWGGGGATQALTDAFQAVLDAGIVVFSSAGNDGISNDPPNVPEVPKNFAGVIGVGAITSRKTLAAYSNFGGKSVMFLTPGDKIISTVKTGDYNELSGTSMASPIAASSYSFILGTLKARCSRSGCSKTKKELQQLALDILCKTADSNTLPGKSICGIIDLEKATETVLKLSI